MKDIDLPSIATTIGILAGLWAFAKLVLKPVMRALWREVHADEVAKWDETCRQSQTNSDRLEWIEESIKEQSRASIEQGRIMRAISRDVNQLIGRMDGPPWDGRTERRHETRREEDEEREAS